MQYQNERDLGVQVKVLSTPVPGVSVSHVASVRIRYLMSVSVTNKNHQTSCRNRRDEEKKRCRSRYVLWRRGVVTMVQVMRP